MNVKLLAFGMSPDLPAFKVSFDFHCGNNFAKKIYQFVADGFSILENGFSLV